MTAPNDPKDRVAKDHQENDMEKKPQPHGRPAEQRERQKSADAPVPDQDAQRAAELEPPYRGDQRGGAPARDLETSKSDVDRRPPG